MEIGRRIKLIAEEKGISVQELANRLGRTRQSIYDIHNGRVSLNTNLLIKIAKELDEPISRFFSDSSRFMVIKKTYPVTCRSCWGSKVMLNPDLITSVSGKPITIPCNACNGSGVITITETETHPLNKQLL